jgi:dihydrofolate reductase
MDADICTGAEDPWRAMLASERNRSSSMAIRNRGRRLISGGQTSCAHGQKPDATVRQASPGIGPAGIDSKATTYDARMAKTQYYCACTLDGYIAEADDTLDWLLKYEGSFEGEGVEPIKGSYDRYYEGVGALVMGSTTYEFVLDELDEWPYKGKPTWVLSTRDLPRPEGEEADVRIVNAKVPDLHQEMMTAAGERNLWVVGGGNVASQFADAGLLDELLVTVVPVVLGEGKPLFDRRLPGGPLQLTGRRTFDSGMVELRYEIRA